MVDGLNEHRDVIPAPLLTALTELQITTASDLLSTAPLALFHRLPAGCTSLRELRATLAHVRRAKTAHGVRADEVLDFGGDANRGAPVRSGIDALDALLGGNFSGKVIEVAGDSASGKTAFALHVVLVHLCTDLTAHALWLDCTGDFVPGRVAPLLGSPHGPGTETALNRIYVYLSFAIDAAYEALASLHMALQQAPDAPAKPRIVVLDTVTALLGPLLTAVSSEGHATMTDFMRHLHLLARLHNLCILVLNNSTRCLPRNPASVFAGTTRKPALGPSFVFLSDATLWLARPPELREDERADSQNKSEAEIEIEIDPEENRGDDAGEGDSVDVHEREDGTEAEHAREAKEVYEVDPELRVAEAFRSKVSPSGRWCYFRIREGILLEA